MSADWKAELRKLKQQPIEEKLKRQEKDESPEESPKSELRKLMKLLKSQLLSVEEVFREEGRREIQQPHIHEYKNGYALVLPITKDGLAPINLRLQFEFHLTEKGYVLKAERYIGETVGPERIIVAPITGEEIRSEVRGFLKERQSIILSAKKEQDKI
jgi:hypothetical protein